MKSLLCVLLFALALSTKLELLEMFHTSFVWKPPANPHIQKLESHLKQLKATKSTKENQCKKIDLDIQAIQNQKEKNQRFLYWLTVRITTNTRRIDKLQSLNCQSSSTFLQVMGIHSQVNRLVQFLRGQVQSESLLQMEDFVSFAQEISINDEYNDVVLALQQQIKECKATFVKPKQGKSDQSKTLLMAVASDVETGFNKDSQQFEINQIKSQDSTNKFIQQLQNETMQLKQHLNQIQSILDRNTFEESQQKRYDQCQVDVQVLNKQIFCTEEALNKLQKCSFIEEHSNKQMQILSEIGKEYQIGIKNLT